MATQVTFHPAGNKLVSRKGLERVADVDPRLTRSHYFDSRLLTAEDLNRDQIYVDGRLREVGRALGYGVMQGLELSLDTGNGRLSLQPGLAVSASGRVLELGRTLTLDLHDRARISELNNGRDRRLNRGLYGVILQYAELGTDIAEVFPTDLAARKTAQYDTMSEAVQIAIVPLRLPILQQNPLHIRAALMQQFYSDSSAAGAIPEDAVALGLLAISDDRPQWLDSELLRQPLRPANAEGELQRDLYRRYQALFDDVMQERRAGALDGDFAASDYFRWLPPAGSLPKQSVDPVNGRQGFFPENYNVWIAPVRRADIELIRRESLLLPPLDLNLEEPMQVVVLAPLQGSDYGRLAARLERPVDAGSGKPGGLDLLRLRLYPQRPVHTLDTDRSTWQSIWDLVDESELFYVRRPLRTAETQMSGIVLQLPQATPGTPLPSASDVNLVTDEGSVFLNRVSIAELTALRSGDADAMSSVQTEFAANANAVQQMLNILLRVERLYDPVIWQTLLTLARNETLVEFLEQLRSQQDADTTDPDATDSDTTDAEVTDPDTTTGAAVVAIGASFGLDAALVARWNEIAATN